MEWSRLSPGGSTGLILSQPMDPYIRQHLRIFGGRVFLVVLLSAPLLLIDSQPPILFLSMLRRVFSLVALSLLLVGLFTRRQVSQERFNLWDHSLAYTLLQLGCSLGLDLVR